MVPNPTNENAATLQIVDGMTVYAIDGEKLGTVRNYDPESGYVDIQKGWLFHKDFYVGLAAIAAVDKHGITLHLSTEHLKDEHFASPPMRGGFAYSESVIPAHASPTDEKAPRVRTTISKRRRQAARSTRRTLGTCSSLWIDTLTRHG